MHIDELFIGRDREIAQLELAIGPGDDGLRLAMLTGPSGLGKTTLTRVLLERARAAGFRVALANGRAGTLSTPFVPWMEALPELKDVLEIARSAATADMDQLGIELVSLLSASTEPMLLVFDDAQALDESSLALLPYAVGVAEHTNLTVLIVEQNDAVGIPDSYRAFVDGLLARRVVRHLELGPMSDDSIRELASHVLELETPAEVPAEIVLRAQGNPWFAKELSDAFRRGASEIPVSIAAAATARLHSLTETAQDVVSAVALCPEGAYIGWLESIADEKPRVFVRTMEAIKASGLVREDGDIVSIAHPLMQQSLLDELSAAMGRALHLELTEVISTVPLSGVTQSRALGYHLSQAGRPDEAVAHYLRAADANDIQGQLHEAVADFIRALDAEPRIEARVALLRRCGFACMQVNNDRAAEFWNELGRISSAQTDNDTYAYALFQQYWTSSDGSAVDRLERATSLGPDKYGWSA
ncbi:MAG: AAA family ATPase, partial [Thermoleophilia bacterium]|nr:AAA family ATPase [Thermoleophilia bacterium]